MSDLISRQDAIDALNGQIKIKKMKDALAIKEYLETVGERIKQIPSAQQEIIRCKECLMRGVCRFEQGLGLDGYCSQAERRTDDE